MTYSPAPFKSRAAAQHPPWLFCVTLLLVCGAIGTLSADEACAQQRTTLSGTVQDAESGETLPSASVYLEGTSLGAATNADGPFVLIGVPAGTR